jgi:glutaconate CoA-transferase subunit A
MERKSVVVDEHAALERIQSGMTIALGGFFTAQHSMAMIRGIAAKGLEDLTVIGGISSSLEMDLLIGYGCVKRVVSAYVGAEAAASIGPFFKRAAEEGKVEVWECDEIIMAAMIQATAAGVPFIPVRGGVGTDLPNLNPDLVPFRDPINDEPLLAVPAMSIDVALTHAWRADQYGHVQYLGSPFLDALMARAAKQTITTVEKLSPPQFIRADPFKTEYTADCIVRAPYGAHPYSCQGAYVEDHQHLRFYAMAAAMATKGDDTAWREYRRRFVDEPRDHLAYLEQVGLRNLLSLDQF